MVVDDLPDLTPARGQVLVEPIACGICGSDLHTVDHAHHLVATATEASYDTFIFDPDADLVMGHEISVRVTGIGDGVTTVHEGGEYAAMPFVLTPSGERDVPGYSNTYPGGYAQQMLLAPEALVPIPNGLDAVTAALTEPMAVGLHAVNESGATPRRAAIVVGGGPVGLAVIASLAAKNIHPIIAADFSPTRRAVAAQMGADVIVDPATDSVFEQWRQHSDGVTPPVIFEAVGVPGIIDQLMTEAPARSEIVIVGVCMSPDSFRPVMGIYKQLSLTFVLGWSPEEFVGSLHNLAEGVIDPSPLVTGQIGLDGVPDAFKALADPNHHVKIMVQPTL